MCWCCLGTHFVEIKNKLISPNVYWLLNFKINFISHKNCNVRTKQRLEIKTGLFQGRKSFSCNHRSSTTARSSVQFILLSVLCCLLEYSLLLVQLLKLDLLILSLDKHSFFFFLSVSYYFCIKLNLFYISENF